MNHAAESHLGPSRQYPRRYIRGRAITQVNGTSGYAHVLQIGEGGMLLTSPEKLKIGQAMVVQFLLPRGKLNLNCEVLYTVPTTSKHGCCVGVRFTNATDAARDVIRSFVLQGMHYTMARRR